MDADVSAQASRRAAVVASMAALLLTLGGVALAQVPFTDIEGNTHRDNIEMLYELGITRGTRPTTYSPRANVRRDQMATFLANSLKHAHPQFDMDDGVRLVLRDRELAGLLPDGTTIGQDEVQAQWDAILEGDEQALPPIGTHFFLTGPLQLIEPDDPGTNIIGSWHFACLVGLQPGRLTCDVVLETDEGVWDEQGGSLYGSLSFNFVNQEEGSEGFPVQMAVIGGTGRFYGATGYFTMDNGSVDVTLTGTVLGHGTRPPFVFEP